MKMSKYYRSFLLIGFLIVNPAQAKTTKPSSLDCNQKAIKHAKLSVTGAYTVSDIICSGEYARGLVTLKSSPEDGGVIFIIKREKTEWKEILAPGTGNDAFEDCLKVGVPLPTCLELFKGDCSNFPRCTQEINKKKQP